MSALFTNLNSTDRNLLQTSVLEDDDAQIARLYNHASFMFPHGLANRPLWELPQLVDLSLRMPDHTDTYWSNGPVAINNPWETGTVQRRTLQETITGIERNNSLVILKHAEQDPVYGPVLKEILGKFVEHAGERMRSDVIVGEVLILIASPNRVTPYHFDAETNFLVQVRGDKTFYVFDRSVLTDIEVEHYFTKTHSSAVYKESFQEKATAYDLHAGYGVHVPPTAPHWVRNGNEVSVALSVNYELRSVKRQSQIYRVNRLMRRLALAPRRPGASALIDRLKLTAAMGLDLARVVTNRRDPAPAYPVWTPPAAQP